MSLWEILAFRNNLLKLILCTHSMKRNESIFVTVWITLCFSGIAIAQTPTGTELEIGPTSSNQVTADYSGAIGQGNEVQSSNSAAIGHNNKVRNTESLAVGHTNELGSITVTDYGGWAGIAVGYFNDNFGDTSAVVGSYNLLIGTDGDNLGAIDSMIVGSYSSSRGIASLVVGEYSVLDNLLEEGPRAAALIGEGLIGKWDTSVVIGKYNNSNIEVDSGLLFAIGNGTGSATNQRSNALEVYDDGTVIIAEPQGDIPMGEFGETP